MLRWMIAALAALAVGFFTLPAMAQWMVSGTECTTRADLLVALDEDRGTEIADLQGPMARAFAGQLRYPPPEPYDEIMIVAASMPGAPLLVVVLHEDCAVAVTMLRASPDQVMEAIRRAAPEA